MKKLKNKKGFTMVESLCTLVVIVLLGAMVGVGINMGSTTLRDSVTVSEANVLFSTLTNVISDELRFSGSFTIGEGGNLVSFFSKNFGTSQAVDSFAVNDSGEVMLGGRKLISSASYTNGVKAVVSVTYDSDIRAFVVYLAIRDGAGKTIVDSNFQVKQLNPHTPTIQ